MFVSQSVQILPVKWRTRVVASRLDVVAAAPTTVVVREAAHPGRYMFEQSKNRRHTTRTVWQQFDDVAGESFVVCVTLTLQMKVVHALGMRERAHHRRPAVAHDCRVSLQPFEGARVGSSGDNSSRSNQL